MNDWITYDAKERRSRDKEDEKRGEIGKFS